jgi:hypothetical protein
MRIVRHRLTEPERRAVGIIVDRAQRLRADAPVTAADGGGLLTLSHADPGHETDYRLDLMRCSAERAALDGVRACLAQVSGSAATIPVLENLPVERTAPALLFLMSSLIGEVREYCGHGAPVVAVANHDATMTDRPSSGNDLAFGLHTDMSFYRRPPDLVAFLMIQPAVAGGESTFCDPMPIVERLAPPVVAALRRPFRFPAPPHMPGGEAQWFPVLDTDGGGGLHVRYRGDGLIAQDAEQAEALAIWERDIAAFELELPLVAGELAVFSNTRLLHGRRGFKDDGDARKRLALRAYVEPRPA